LKHWIKASIEAFGLQIMDFVKRSSSRQALSAAGRSLTDPATADKAEKKKRV
jgi:hypothetical protein